MHSLSLSLSLSLCLSVCLYPSLPLSVCLSLTLSLSLLSLSHLHLPTHPLKIWTMYHCLNISVPEIPWRVAGPLGNQPTRKDVCSLATHATLSQHLGASLWISSKHTVADPTQLLPRWPSGKGHRPGFGVCLPWGSHLVGLVVKESASRAEDPGFESRLRWDFFGVESYQWLKKWHSSGYPARRLAL